MKILELRLKNLNSLYGEWVIDFTVAEYAANGIFALSGPTGAGKSTILDAICLALYGATPRLGKITKSGNEIMSRQTGVCYAEVTFASQAGTYRCHWAQHRARKKADGNLMDARHEIVDAASGKVLETKKRDVAIVIEEKTGMDFDRFTRSILLAQGGFDTFLKADVEQKSRILEQITGTELYTEISIRVHERLRDEREKLRRLSEETAGISILDEKEEATIVSELGKKKEQESEAVGWIAAANKAVEWLVQIQDLQQDLVVISKEAEALQGDLTAFIPIREKLDQARRAAELEGAYGTLTAERSQQKADQEALRLDEARTPEREALLRRKQEHLKTSEASTSQARAAYKEQMQLFHQVRLLDQQLLDKKKQMDVCEAECRKIAAGIDAHLSRQKELGVEKEKACREQARIQQYISVNSGDEGLVTQFAGIREQLNHLNQAVQETIEKKDRLDSAKKKGDLIGRAHAVRIKDLEKCQKEQAVLHNKITLQQKELGQILGDRLLREYRSEKEGLLREMAFLRRIADLEEERGRLEDGRPCPLCGSRTHPYAEGNVPARDKTEQRIDALDQVVRKAEKVEAHIKELESREKQAIEAVRRMERMAAESVKEKESAETVIMNLTEELASLNGRVSEQKDSARSMLKPYGIGEVPEKKVSSLLSILEARLHRWNTNQQQKVDIEKKVAGLEAEIKQMNLMIDMQRRLLSERQEELHSLGTEFDDKTMTRKKLFGDRMPDQEQIRLEKMVTDAENGERSAREQQEEAQQKVKEVKVRIVSLQERIANRADDLKARESAFRDRLAQSGFGGEPSFLRHRLDPSERNRLEEKARELDERQVDILSRKKDREKRLADALARNLTASTREELLRELKKREDAADRMREEIADLKHRVAANKAAREKIRTKQILIDQQTRECRRWEKLHSMIGSADGKKYRNFAQGLTFELMITHANRQLAKMTDRYLLIREESLPLELNVMDNYQAGEIRSTRNLSGGESFIVSLALALGLSQMASRKVRVDSLFLDEGFGTLDEESLETALDTLAGLHQDGKLIGVISHVPVLKERIGTLIDVVPVSGGKSRIYGPGCRQIQAGGLS